jgi:hypothetical protein
MKEYIQTAVYALLLVVHFIASLWMIEIILNEMSKSVHVVVFVAEFIAIGIILLAFAGSMYKFIKHLKSYIS